MKITFMSKAAFLLAQALILCGSLQAESQVIQEDVQQVRDLLTSTDFEADSLSGRNGDHRNPNLQHLYAFNTQVLTSTTVISPGNDVPFNNGTSAFPPDALVKGNGIHQLYDTDFLIYEDGNYLVTFYGYNHQGFNIDVGVQLFVNEQATGPAHITSAIAVDTLLSFSQIVRISGASIRTPAVLEVRATLGQALILRSGLSDGVNATLEIIKLNP